MYRSRVGRLVGSLQLFGETLYTTRVQRYKRERTNTPSWFVHTLIPRMPTPVSISLLI